MKITWNGIGSAWAANNGNSSAVLQSGETRLLLDCGHTVPHRLTRMGTNLKEMNAVFISHLHGDHVYGLEEWGFRNILMWDRKPHLFIEESLAEPLWKRVLFGTMAQVCEQRCHLEDYFTVVPMREGRSETFGPFHMEIRTVRHVPNAVSFGLRVTAPSEDGTGEVRAGFTCDSLADNDGWFYDKTRLVFHDCSFAPPFPGTVHAHFAELKKYSADFRARTMLVHYDDTIPEKRCDPAWQAELDATKMRLTDPFVPIIL